MANGNTSTTFQGVTSSKSRLVLGDLTNRRMGKRESSQFENSSLKSCNIVDKDSIKRSRPYSGSNSVSSISKIPPANNHDSLNDVSIELNIFDIDMVESSDDESDTSCKDGVPRVVKADLQACDANKVVKISQSVNELDIFDNDMVDSSDEDDSMNKMASQNHKDPPPTLLVLEEGRVPSSIATEADNCSKLDLLKEIEVPKLSQVGAACKSPTLEHGVNVGDVMSNDGREVALGSSQLSNLGLNGRNVAPFVKMENTEESGDTSRTMSESFDIDEAKVNLKCSQSETCDYQNDTDDLVFSQSGSIDCTVFPESQESRVYGLEGTTNSEKRVECANISGGVDSIRDCSCSFCTKAAYILLDLNYQDIKARLSALKKSQKEATILAERSGRNITTENHGSERLTRVPNIESNLKHQWRSLFQNMATVWGEEGNQLEASLLPLSDLKEKCKTDLELMNATPSEKH